MNLIESLQNELNRCRELVVEYDAMGPVGVFAKTMITQEIKEAEKMISTGDTIGMLRLYEQLQGCN